MLIKRRFLLFVALLITGLPLAGLSGDGHAAGQIRAVSSKPSTLIKGTWRSAKETLTFSANGTIIFRGKKYYYAVSNGGTIQLTGKYNSLTIPYQLRQQTYPDNRRQGDGLYPQALSG
jgi:hypothetical protein